MRTSARDSADMGGIVERTPALRGAGRLWISRWPPGRHRTDTGRAQSSDRLLRAVAVRLELVAHPVARLDERMRGARGRELVAQLADEHVHGAVAVGLPSPPHPLEYLVSGHDPAALERQRVEQPKLRRRQLGALPADVRLNVHRIHEELLRLDRLAPALLGRANAPAGGGAHAGDELLHREGLHEVVVRSDLERMDAVVLGPARADDDDGRPDPLGPRRLDEAP